MKATRRVFLGSGAVLAGRLASSRAWAASPNNEIVVAVIGCGAQGRLHVETWTSRPGVRLAYICDVDQTSLAEAAKLAPSAKPVTDLRHVLDDRQVTAVSIATPDHWHTPAALLALDAGKHVYVEKPCSHNVREGRLLVEAADKSKLFVQTGTQTRSSRYFGEAIQMLHEGVIGDLLVAKAWNVQLRKNIGHAAPQTPPSHLDYDMWVGPAPMIPFQSNRYMYDWRWFYHFGCGDAGNDGIHDIDYARWGLGVETHPSIVSASGGKYFFDDDQEFPDTMTAVFEYPGDGRIGRRRQLVFEMRLWSTNYPYNVDSGIEFYGTKGQMFISKRGKFQLLDARNKRVERQLSGDSKIAVPDHVDNFLAAIRGNAKLSADARTGHLSASLCHLANMAVRVGRGLRFDPDAEQIIGDNEANELLARNYRRDHWAVPNNSRA